MRSRKCHHNSGCTCVPLSTLVVDILPGLISPGIIPQPDFNKTAAVPMHHWRTGRRSILPSQPPNTQTIPLLDASILISTTMTLHILISVFDELFSQVASTQSPTVANPSFQQPSPAGRNRDFREPVMHRHPLGPWPQSQPCLYQTQF